MSTKNDSAIADYPKGFFLMPFPVEIQRAMAEEISHYVLGLGGLKFSGDPFCPAHQEKMLRIVGAFCQEDFVMKMVKGMRTFSAPIGELIENWTNSTLKSILRAQQISLTPVSELDRANNSALRADDWDIYWRCVRPDKPDVGQWHYDRQFADLNVGSARAIPDPFAFSERWRVWLPLMGCTSNNSIRFIPRDVVKAEVPLASLDTPHGPRPKIKDEWVAQYEPKAVCPLESFLGEGVVFRDDVVHRGPRNSDEYLRISGEFTIVLT